MGRNFIAKILNVFAISLLTCQTKRMACQKIRHLAIQYVIVLYLENMAKDMVPLGFNTGIPRVGFSRTVPVPPNTVPAAGYTRTVP